MLERGWELSEALQFSTINPASFLHLDSKGRIAVSSFSLSSSLSLSLSQYIYIYIYVYIYISYLLTYLPYLLIVFTVHRIPGLSRKILLNDGTRSHVFALKIKFQCNDVQLV